MLGLGNSLSLGGAPSEFTLTDISGLDIWLKYDTGFTVDGSDLISQWDDQSGNGNNAVQATAGQKPTLVGGGADLDGAVGSSADKIAFSTITNVTYTYFIVIEADSSAKGTLLGMNGDTGTFFRINQGTSIEYRVRKGSTADEDRSDLDTSAEPFIDASTPMLIVFQQKAGLDFDVHTGGNGADSKHEEDNFGVQGGGTNTTLSIDHLGTTGNNTVPFNGRILEFACYDSILSDADIALVKASISTRTGVDLG